MESSVADQILDRFCLELDRLGAWGLEVARVFRDRQQEEKPVRETELLDLYRRIAATLEDRSL